MVVILVNPDCRSNRDIPSVALGYVSQHWGALVIDANTTSEPCVDRTALWWLTAGEEVRALLTSRSVAEYRRLVEANPHLRWGTVTTSIGGQCCYAEVADGRGCLGNLHVEPLPAVPRYDLFSSFHTFREEWMRGVWPYPLYTSYHCVYGCTFCAERHGRWEPRPLADIDAELRQAVEDYGARLLTPIDPLFNPPHNATHPLQVCEIIGRYGVQWACTNGLRADNLTDELAGAMARSGCRTVGIGVETLDDGLLKAIRKGETADQIERGLRVARDHFASVSAFVILGLPGSSAETDERTILRLLKIGVYVHLSHYVPRGQEDAVFYGTPESEYPPGRWTYPGQWRLWHRYRSLAWGSARDAGANLAARLRLLGRGQVRAARRLLAMDAAKWWARATR